MTRESQRSALKKVASFTCHVWFGRLGPTATVHGSPSWSRGGRGGKKPNSQPAKASSGTSGSARAGVSLVERERQCGGGSQEMRGAIGVDADDVESNERRNVLLRGAASEAARRVRDGVASTLQAREHDGIRPLLTPPDDEDPDFEIVTAARFLARPADLFHDRSREGQLVALLETDGPLSNGHGRGANRDGDNQQGAEHSHSPARRVATRRNHSHIGGSCNRS